MIVPNTVTIFGQEISIVSNYDNKNHLLIEPQNTCSLIDNNFRSSIYVGNKKPLYFFQKSTDEFEYFYFDVNQIWFIGEFLFIPDFFVNRSDTLKLLLKEPLIAQKTKKIFLDPFCTTNVFVIDCSNLTDVMILLQILNKTQQLGFHNAKRVIKSCLPEYGKKILAEAELAFKELLQNKKRNSETHCKSFANWLTRKEKEYVGKIEGFESFHEFQKEVLLNFPNSLKCCSIFLGFLCDLFMGSGKTVIACTGLDYLREYFEEKIKFIVLCPVSVKGNWKNNLEMFGLNHLTEIYSWDSFHKLEQTIQNDTQYYVICDESHNAYGDSLRNQNLFEFLNRKNIMGSLQLTGTPYTGKPKQIVWVAKLLGHQWGKYPAYYQKQLEKMTNCSEYVKEQLQDCLYSLTLEETKIRYPNFKIPHKDDVIINLNLADPQFNDEYGSISYLKEYESCLLEIVRKLSLDSINDIPKAIKSGGNYMTISQKLLKLFETLKTDWVLQHSIFPTILQNDKIVFFCKYIQTVDQLYLRLGHFNDHYHLSEGNYKLKPRQYNMVDLQLKIGRLEEKQKQLALEQSKIFTSHNGIDKIEMIDKEIRHIKKELSWLTFERQKLAFTHSIKSKPDHILEKMNQKHLKAILSEEMYISDYQQGIISGSVKAKDRQARIDAFNSSESKVRFLICTLGAGGTGVNLQSCKYGVHLGIGDNFINYEQSLMRIARHGNQHDNVTMYQIMFGNNDIHNKQMNLEESLLNIYLTKKQIVTAIKLEQFEQTPLHELTLAELYSKAAESMGFDKDFAARVDAKI